MKGHIEGYKLRIIRQEDDNEKNPNYKIIEEGKKGFAGDLIKERKQAIIDIALETMRKYDEKERFVIKGPDIPVEIINLEKLVGNN